MSIHKDYNKLTPTEKAVVDDTFRAVYTIAKDHGVPLAGDDRVERAVEALATAVIESRK